MPATFPSITIDGHLVNQPTSLLSWYQFNRPIYLAIGMTETVDASGNITLTSPQRSVAQNAVDTLTIVQNTSKDLITLDKRDLARGMEQ